MTPGARRLALELGIQIVMRSGDLVAPDSAAPSQDTFAGRLDSTLLAALATPDQIEQLAREAIDCRFAAVCVNPVFVPLVSKLLAGTGVAVACVVGFPLGASASSIKALEARLAVDQGATEIDMVMPLGLAKAADWRAVARDVAEVRAAAPRPNVVLKVIVEAPVLTPEELDRAAITVVEAGADFVKTGTGTSGAVQPEHVIRVARVVGQRARIKAAGGIRNLETAMALLDLGAHRLGTSNAAALVREANRAAS